MDPAHQHLLQQLNIPMGELDPRLHEAGQLYAVAMQQQPVQQLQGAPPQGPGQGRKRRAGLAGTSQGLSPDQSVIELRKQQPKRQRQQASKPTRICQVEKCTTQPSYNFPGQTRRVFCASHKKEGMINLATQGKCRHTGCRVGPRFNYPHIPSGLYCDSHKLEGMENVVDRRCAEQGCSKYPTFNYSQSAGRVFCQAHRKPGMIDKSRNPPNPNPPNQQA